MDSQFMRKSKESKIAYAARTDESGEYQIIEKHRPSGRQKIVASGLRGSEAAKLRNELIGSSEG